ncbi:uroporphyrinogen-III synthase [Eudoraea sp.]|uniref:uroporphyrinogen-III synthase n=1 Tax=Eudoraea sp. TaxID=1979955 RepID=UPI003C72E59B
MNTVLSTKSLSSLHQKQIIELGLKYDEYDAINIEFIDFKNESYPENIIFTSQNAVLSFLKNKDVKDYFKSKGKCFCVGHKTKSLLELNNMEVLVCAENSATLGKIIIKNYASLSFVYFCGNRRREELPNLLKSKNINLNEVEVYNTHLNVLPIEMNYDAVLFFSPSAVISYTQLNNLQRTTAFCIGPTTAKEAQKNTSKIVVAKHPSTKDLIFEISKHSRNLNTENDY